MPGTPSTWYCMESLEYVKSISTERTPSLVYRIVYIMRTYSILAIVGVLTLVVSAGIHLPTYKWSTPTAPQTQPAIAAYLPEIPSPGMGTVIGTRDSEAPSTVSQSATVTTPSIQEQGTVPHIEVPSARTHTSDTGAFSPEVLNTHARGVLVNIICTTKENLFKPVSGSGVIIDSRGIILTNAHVAQYVLLQDVGVTIECSVRTGSPARPIGTPRVLFIPDVWIQEHAHEIADQKAQGTGEYDVALLFVEAETPLPHTPIDTTEATIQEGVSVLAGSYAAGFTGGILVQRDLFASTAITTIGTLYTFGSGSTDLFSLGGIILAQSGSSGGGVFNQAGSLIGLIVTATDALTTGERDVRALSTVYIRTFLEKHLGMSLYEFLSQDAKEQTTLFQTQKTKQYAAPLLNTLGIPL